MVEIVPKEYIVPVIATLMTLNVLGGTVLFLIASRLIGALGYATSSKPVRLDFSPQRLGALDYASLGVLIGWKYVAGALRLSAGLDACIRTRKSTAGEDEEVFVLPRVRILAPLTVAEADLAAFRAAVAPAADADEAALGANPLLLPALTTPLLLMLLAARPSPIKPLGAVNTRNRFACVRPDLVARVLASAAAGAGGASGARGGDEDTYVGKAYAVATLGGEGDGSSGVDGADGGGGDLLGRRVKRGMQFAARIDVFLAGVAAQDGTPKDVLVLTQRIEVLQFLPRTHRPAWRGGEAASEAVGATPEQDGGAAVELALDLQAPGRWAKCCGDYNPIHVSAALGRLFGFAGKVAHGNLVAAASFDRMISRQGDDNRLRELLGGAESRAAPWWAEVDFKRPVIVPAAVTVKAATTTQGSGESRFEVQGTRGTTEGKVCMVGRAGKL